LARGREELKQRNYKTIQVFMGNKGRGIESSKQWGREECDGIDNLKRYYKHLFLL
jgi:hypothetical protein